MKIFKMFSKDFKERRQRTNPLFLEVASDGLRHGSPKSASHMAKRRWEKRR